MFNISSIFKGRKMQKYKKIKRLNPEEFRRLTGVKPGTFKEITGVLKEEELKRKTGGNRHREKRRTFYSELLRP